MKEEFLICESCGNIIKVIESNNNDIICCNEKMSLLRANIIEASAEKHVPIITKNDNKLVITVGDIPHPMEEKHYIKWIYVITNKCTYMCNLNPGEMPEITLLISDDEKVLSAYAYCNIHGLWQNKN